MSKLFHTLDPDENPAQYDGYNGDYDYPGNFTQDYNTLTPIKL